MTDEPSRGGRPGAGSWSDRFTGGTPERMTETLSYILAGIALTFANCMAWVATFFGLPGTWVIVALTALTCHFFPSSGHLGLSWWSIGALGVLALTGEIW